MIIIQQIRITAGLNNCPSNAYLDHTADWNPSRSQQLGIKGLLCKYTCLNYIKWPGEGHVNYLNITTYITTMETNTHRKLFMKHVSLGNRGYQDNYNNDYL